MNPTAHFATRARTQRSKRRWPYNRASIQFQIRLLYTLFNSIIKQSHCTKYQSPLLSFSLSTRAHAIDRCCLAHSRHTSSLHRIDRLLATKAAERMLVTWSLISQKVCHGLSDSLLGKGSLLLHILKKSGCSRRLIGLNRFVAIKATSADFPYHRRIQERSC